MMTVDSSLPSSKRRRFSAMDSMDSEIVQVMRAKLAAIKEEIGREIRVFETSQASMAPKEIASIDEADDTYEFTAADYFRVMSIKKEDNFLKTRKIRDAEEAARKSKMSKSLIRVRFPDNCTFELAFHSSETFQSLFDVLKKVIARPELPFYIYTTPPKKQIKDMSQDFYSAGFIPGAIVYFSYDLPKGYNGAAGYSGPFLREEIMFLKGFNMAYSEPAEQAEPVQSATRPVLSVVVSSSAFHEPKPAEKKLVRPKWLKM